MAAAEGLKPLEYMRKYAAFEVTKDNYVPYEKEVSADGAKTDDQGRHRRCRVIGLNHRGDLGRAVRKSRDRIAIGPRERCIGEGFRSGRRGDAASARPLAHRAERVAAAAGVRYCRGGRLPAAVHLDRGHMASGLAAVVLPGGEPRPETG